MTEKACTWQVIEGDCLKVLPTLDDASVDAVITDPPYGMAYQSARRIDKAERFDQIANDDQPYVWWLRDAARIIKPGGCLICFCRWDSSEAFRMAIGWAGLRVVTQIVWDREIHGMGDLGGAPAPQHDTIWFAVKGKYVLPGKRPASVVRHARLSGDALTHPNEKPHSLMVGLVESYTMPGATVCDPFAGSGATGVACVRTARNFIGCELDPAYAALSRRRIGEAANHLFSGAPAND